MSSAPLNQPASDLNEALIARLKESGVLTAAPVEAAFRAVHRHLFLPDVPLEDVYANRSIPLRRQEDGRYLSSSSQPSVMAIMLEQLDLQPGHRVLEIGAGSGYNAALLAHLVGPSGRVTTVEFDEELAAGARDHLAAAGFPGVRVIAGDGGLGDAATAPFDRLILTVAAADIAPAWWEQLLPGGRLVMPLNVAGGAQRSLALQRTPTHWLSQSARACGFVTLRGAFAAPPRQESQLGPDPGLTLELPAGVTFDGDRVYAWLIGPSRDWPTGVSVTVGDLLYGGLRLWLALHAPEIGELNARGELIQNDLVPPLIHLTGGWQVMLTMALLAPNGLAALVRPPGQPAPQLDPNDPDPTDAPFELFVRHFGGGAQPAQRLVKAVRAWEAAGRPSAESLQIRLYPRFLPDEPGPAPINAQFTIDRPHHTIAIDWHQ